MIPLAPVYAPATALIAIRGAIPARFGRHPRSVVPARFILLLSKCGCRRFAKSLSGDQKTNLLHRSCPLLA
ncbi:hypothetical protein [Desulforamulus hydrothermalis]|uniref:hypothetical protein n=1 Tax=Desulforamulus hydrothermalis TaxID=412895 RepID=UPI00135F1206|nr:hypothetical protein [Desulforamulus hydrothermalis]